MMNEINEINGIHHEVREDKVFICTSDSSQLSKKETSNSLKNCFYNTTKETTQQNIDENMMKR